MGEQAVEDGLANQLRSFASHLTATLSGPPSALRLTGRAASPALARLRAEGAPPNNRWSRNLYNNQ